MDASKSSKVITLEYHDIELRPGDVWMMVQRLQTSELEDHDRLESLSYLKGLVGHRLELVWVG